MTFLRSRCIALWANSLAFQQCSLMEIYERKTKLIVLCVSTAVIVGPCVTQRTESLCHVNVPRLLMTFVFPQSFKPIGLE